MKPVNCYWCLLYVGIILVRHLASCAQIVVSNTARTFLTLVYIVIVICC